MAFFYLPRVDSFISRSSRHYNGVYSLRRTQYAQSTYHGTKGYRTEMLFHTLKNMLYTLGVYKAVIPILAMIEQIESARNIINEKEKFVSQYLHLIDCFFD